jgi:hypothetical protein
MSLQDQVSEVIKHFDSINLSTLAELANVRISDRATKIGFEQSLCNMMISGRLSGYQIEEDFICVSFHSGGSSERLENVLTKISSIN